MEQSTGARFSAQWSKFRRKTLALAVALVMVVGLLPTSALATVADPAPGLESDNQPTEAAAVDESGGEGTELTVAADDEPVDLADDETVEVKAIDSVAITAVTTPAEGIASTTAGIATSTTGATVTSAEWLCETGGGSFAPFSGTFEAGKTYAIQVTVAAGEGYALAGGATASINGEGVTFEASSGIATCQYAQLSSASSEESAVLAAQVKKQDDPSASQTEDNPGAAQAAMDEGDLNPDPGTVVISFTKYWDGVPADEQPDSIIVKLYKYLNDQVGQLIPVATATVTKASGWKYDFDISNEPLYEGTEYSEDTAYKFKIVEDPIEGFVETAHTDPQVIFTPPTVDGDWTRHEPCNELEIDTSVDAKSIIVGKKGNRYVVWSAEPLSLSERKIVYQSALSINGMSGAKFENFTFFSGWGSSSQFGMTVSDGLVSFNKKSDWSFFGTGTYNKSSAEANASSITNTKIQPVSITLGAAKMLNAASGLEKPDVSGKYDLTIAAVTDGAPMPATTSIKNPDGNGSAVNFGSITFTEPGVYSYTVSESGSVPGVSNGQSSYGVTVTVTLDGTQLKAEITSGGAVTMFTNTYKVNEVSIELSASKTLAAADGLTPPDVSGKYDLAISAAEGTPLPETTTVKNPDGNGTPVSFGEITYSDPGTYTYTITESGTVNGVTNGTSSYEVKVAVTDNLDGTMTAEVTSGNQNTNFTNTYSVKPATAKIPVEKILEIPEGLEGPDDITGAYTFTLSAAEGAPLPETTKLANPDADGGTVIFGDITYTKPGTYHYTVTEEGAVDGVTNDSQASKLVEVVVADNGDGTMTATVNNGNTLAFTNAYDVDPTTIELGAAKVLEAADGLTPPDVSGKYDLTIVGEGSETPMPATTTIKNVDGSGTAKSFGAITYTKPGTYTYTITESGTVPGVSNGQDSYNVTVTAKDNGDGTMTAEVTSGNQVTTFTNTYSVEPVMANIPVEKILSAPEGLSGPDITEAYTFTLTSEDDAPLPEVTELKNPDANGGTVEFGSILYEEPGTYTYAVTESGEVAGVENDAEAEAGKTVTVVVADNGDGTMTATVNGGETLSFTNTLITGKLIVTKEIAGNAAESNREFNFTVTLSDATISGEFGGMAFENGVATFTLKGGERKVASNLPSGITYTVAEDDYSADGYVTAKEGDTGSIVGNGEATAAFTNTKNVKEEKKEEKKDTPNIPKTGDPIMPFSLIALAGVAGLCMASTVRSNKRNGKRN